VQLIRFKEARTTFLNYCVVMMWYSVEFCHMLEAVMKKPADNLPVLLTRY